MSQRWDRHFLRMALECAGMSKDPNTSVGAVVVGPDREIRATGFNGFPQGVIDMPDRLADRELKNRLMVHAERNCICNAARVGVPLKGCVLYLAATDASSAVWGGAPCVSCTIGVIQVGIVEVVSPPQKVPTKRADDLRMAGELLKEAGIMQRCVSLPASVEQRGGEATEISGGRA